MLLLLVFCSLASAPLLASTSDPENNLPACCRRNGKHHCMMLATMRQIPGTAVSAPPEKCPLFPKGISPAVTHDHWLAPPRGTWSFAIASGSPRPVAHDAISRRTQQVCAHGKRGPPAQARVDLSPLPRS